MNTQITQPANLITPIDSKSIIEHGDSPTAIILAIAILVLLMFNGLTGLIQVIIKQSK
jgi:hypothetical protein